MTEPFTVTLSNSTVITVTEHVNYETGLIAYTVAGTRLSGTVTVNPEYQCPTDTWITQIVLASGLSYGGDYGSDPLIIDGEEFCGGYYVNLDEGPRAYFPFPFCDEDNGWQWNMELDAHLLRYVEDVMQALTYLWKNRSDTDMILDIAERFQTDRRRRWKDER